MTFDLLVVGGGIQGAAVARDAALRGLTVLLLDRGDLASGTSSRSSKLIHGGIRYLETGEFGLVRDALRERARLLEMAPEFVRPLPFLIPHYRGEGRNPLLVRLGLALYSVLAGRHPLTERRRLTSSEALALEPSLAKEGLQGAWQFWDAQMDDAPLCIAVGLDAGRAGASLRTYTELKALERHGPLWRARVYDSIPGEEGEAAARCVVNAAGPWAEQIRAMAGATARAGLRRTRGSHVVVPAVVRECGLLLTARRDGRVLFALPWGGHSLIGTTDVDDDVQPERVRPTSDDVRYLLDEACRALPGLDPARRPLRAFAGLRSLVQGSAIRPWSNRREHRILEEGTMLTLIGGKYTTHRSLAERVVDRVAHLLGIRAGPCRTATTPLPTDRSARLAGLAAFHPGRLHLGEGLEVTEAEVVNAVQTERARRLGDVLLRRTRLWLDAAALRGGAQQVAAWMAPHLGWSAADRASEVAALLEELDEESRILDQAMDRRRGVP